MLSKLKVPSHTYTKKNPLHFSWLMWFQVRDTWISSQHSILLPFIVDFHQMPIYFTVVNVWRQQSLLTYSRAKLCEKPSVTVAGAWPHILAHITFLHDDFTVQHQSPPSWAAAGRSCGHLSWSGSQTWWLWWNLPDCLSTLRCSDSLLPRACKTWGLRCC